LFGVLLEPTHVASVIVSLDVPEYHPHTFLRMGGSNFIWRKPSTESGISGKPQAAAALGIAVAAGLSGCD
jgi:hypothetical protein